MRLFGSKKKEEKGAAPKVPAAKPVTGKKKTAAAKPKQTPDTKTVLTGKVLLRPHVTEKAAHLTAQNVFAFNVSPRATKRDVAEAVRAVYNVVPKKIAIVKTPGKKKRLRTRRGFGTRAAAKKAYVYLKDGDRIEFSS